MAQSPDQTYRKLCEFYETEGQVGTSTVVRDAGAHGYVAWTLGTSQVESGGYRV